jgi:tryptophan-rich sensory protein
MTLAVWLVWRRRGVEAEIQVILFTAQLLLNVLWTFLFFSLRAPGAALAEIVCLWFLILATILAFRRVSKTAALLLVPYLLWVTFAAALNYEFWRLNS